VAAKHQRARIKTGARKTKATASRARSAAYHQQSGIIEPGGMNRASRANVSSMRAPRPRSRQHRYLRK